MLCLYLPRCTLRRALLCSIEASAPSGALAQSSTPALCPVHYSSLRLAGGWPPAGSVTRQVVRCAVEARPFSSMESKPVEEEHTATDKSSEVEERRFVGLAAASKEAEGDFEALLALVRRKTIRISGAQDLTFTMRECIAWLHMLLKLDSSLLQGPPPLEVSLVLARLQGLIDAMEPKAKAQSLFRRLTKVARYVSYLQYEGGGRAAVLERVAAACVRSGLPGFKIRHMERLEVAFATAGYDPGPALQELLRTTGEELRRSEEAIRTEKEERRRNKALRRTRFIDLTATEALDIIKALGQLGPIDKAGQPQWWSKRCEELCQLVKKEQLGMEEDLEVVRDAFADAWARLKVTEGYTYTWNSSRDALLLYHLIGCHQAMSPGLRTCSDSKCGPDLGEGGDPQKDGMLLPIVSHLLRRIAGKGCHPGEDWLATVARECVRRGFAGLEGGRLAKVLYGLAMCNHRVDEAFLHHFYAHTERLGWDSFTLVELQTMLWALVAMDVRVGEGLLWAILRELEEAIERTEGLKRLKGVEALPRIVGLYLYLRPERSEVDLELDWVMQRLASVSIQSQRAVSPSVPQIELYHKLKERFEVELEGMVEMLSVDMIIHLPDGCRVAVEVDERSHFFNNNRPTEPTGKTRLKRRLLDEATRRGVIHSWVWVGGSEQEDVEKVDDAVKAALDRGFVWRDILE